MAFNFVELVLCVLMVHLLCSALKLSDNLPCAHTLQLNTLLLTEKQ